MSPELQTAGRVAFIVIAIPLAGALWGHLPPVRHYRARKAVKAHAAAQAARQWAIDNGLGEHPTPQDIGRLVKSRRSQTPQ